MTVENLHDSIGAGPELNSQPLDLQSDWLLTVLWDPVPPCVWTGPVALTTCRFHA